MALVENSAVKARFTRAQYVVVHLVCQESDKDLVGPQVMDHALAHIGSGNGDEPSDVIVGFLEPLRHAVTQRIRARVRQHADRAPGVKTILLPYVSRFGTQTNIAHLALRLSPIIGSRRVIFHCRGESAVEWAIALQSRFPGSAIVADIRGAWPDELLFARGFDSLEEADCATKRSYASALTKAQRATSMAQAVFTVSPGLLDWLRKIGVPNEKLTYVPCCITGTTVRPGEREAMRERLELKGRLVLCYAGTITRYQHIPDGVLPFFLAASAADPDLHLLCVTPQLESFRQLILESGVPEDRVTLIAAQQRDVASYLSAADAGLLLRAPGLLTNLAQPTKFAEYLSAGLLVIIAHGVGDLADQVESAGAGAAVSLFGLGEAEFSSEAREVCRSLRVNKDRWRENAIDLCQRHFIWSRYIPRVREAYTAALERASTSIENSPPAR